MPANPKYLNPNPWQRFAKISAGIFGGYIISALLHIDLAFFLPFHKEVLAISIYTLFIIWAGLILLPFFFKNGWKCWLLYLIIIILLYILYDFGNLNNPF